MTRRGLGRGLGALIPGAGERAGEDDPQTQLDITQVSPNPFQPRRDISGPEFDELVASIRSRGVLQPIIARRSGAGYEIVAGERRWRAARAAGLTIIPAVVKDLSDREMLEVALVENLRRQDLNPMERASAYRRLGDEFGLTQTQVSEAVGSSRSAIANTVRLLDLPSEVQGAISRGRISEGHGRALLAIEDREALLAAWKTVEDRGLSVRETEDLTKASNLVVSRETRNRHTQQNPDLADLARQIGERYATTAAIVKSGKGGSIKLSFYSDVDLERLIEILMHP